MAPPNKLRVKQRQPNMTTQTLLDFDLGESSSDSDFRIEDHDESDDDFSENSNADYSDKDDENEDDEESGDDECSDSASSELKYLLSSQSAHRDSSEIKKIVANAIPASIKDKFPINPICCACLGDRSDDTNEIVECDWCGVSVHEGCYGVSDSTSVSSTISSCSTEPWFCEACKAGILEPTCELCPNRGGIFKETDVGRWVHLVCALYVPGVAFGEVDQLTSVTLFEMPYSKWGAKTCSLCEDAKFARTGVCIGCDAGMCKTYFHVTCAQAAGFLSEAHSEEADHADPFYAHCKVHSDKSMIKHRKRNYNMLKLRMEQQKLTKSETQSEKQTIEQLRIQRKLTKHQSKYKSNKTLKMEPWVPTQKMPRLLITSATACSRLLKKAQLDGIDTDAMEFQETQMAALVDVRKKWHIPPAFSVEFIGYYLDRNSRLKDIKTKLDRHIETNAKLIAEQQKIREDYDKKVKLNNELVSKNTKLKEQVTELHKQIEALCPNKSLPAIEHIGRPVLTPTTVPSPRPMSVPTAAALKMGVGFPLMNLVGTKDDSGRILSTQRQNNELVHECGICKRCNDQHLLAKCDTCHFYYHLGCLNPPLTRHPKKSKLYGWQCSECDKSDDSDAIADLPKGPRKSRTRFTKDGMIVPVDQNISNTESNSSKNGTSPPKRKSTDKPIKKEKSLNNDVKSEKSSPTSPGKSSNSNTQKIKKPKNSAGVKKLKLDGTPEIVNNSIVHHNCENNAQIKLEEDDKIKCEGQIPSTNASDVENLKTKIKVSKKMKKERKSAANNDPSTNNTPHNLLHSVTDASIGYVSNTLIAYPGTVTNAEESVDHIQRQNRKRRKEKHKNKYTDDNDKSPNKEHKRKRKKKSHDRDNVNDSVPKIKIKLKSVPMPGESAPEPKFFYLTADMVQPMDTSRPTSVETVDDSTVNADDVNQVMSPLGSVAASSTPMSNHLGLINPKTKTKSRLASPRKLNRSDSTSQPLNLETHAKEQICDVCREHGTTQNLVKCDDCAKNYHFTCLDPPLKKTPKKRGYSWHCADCDPTDREST